MRQPYKSMISLVILCLLLANAVPALAGPPILPSSFYGTVKTGGVNVPVGSKVKAKINGVQYAITTVIVYGSDTVYSLDVPADDPGTPGVIEGGVEGNTVIFYVNNQTVNETGTWHSGTNAALNLTVKVAPGFSISGNAGVGGAILSYTDGTYKTATADASGKYSFTVSYGWSGSVTPSKTGYTFLPNHLDYDNVVTARTAQNYRAIQSKSFMSIAAYDGWVLESRETSNSGLVLNASATTFNLGDDAARRQYRAILSFNTTLPGNAIITSVILKIKKAGQGGANPFSTLGNILVDICRGSFGNNAALQSTDFQAVASKIAGLTLPNTPVNSWYSRALSSANFGYINKAGVTQFRLRFTKDDNNNGVADYLKFYSGNAPASSRPVLVISYYVP